jgi:hypothetical protein
MKIWRNYERTEHDDYELNVSRHTDKYHWATEILDSDNKIVGWEIKPAHE